MKKILTICLAAVLLLGLWGCGNTAQPVYPQTGKPKPTEKPIYPDTATQIGQVAEFSIVHAFSTPDVKPPKPSTIYTHYEAESGKTYFVLVTDIKNLGKNAVAAEEILTVTLTVGEAKYDAKVAVESSDGSSLNSGYTYIDALGTARVYQMYSVPEAADLQNFTLTIKNGTEVYASEFTLSSLESKVKTLREGETVTCEDTLSFTLDRVEFADTLYPPTPDGYYHYYTAESGKTFLIVKMTVTNLKGSNLKYSAIAGVSCVYNEKYHYSFFTVFEEDGGQDLNSYPGQYAIMPLDTGVVYYLAEVPRQVAGGPVKISFYIAGNYYTYTCDMSV